METFLHFGIKAEQPLQVQPVNKAEQSDFNKIYEESMDDCQYL